MISKHYAVPRSVVLLRCVPYLPLLALSLCLCVSVANPSLALAQGPNEAAVIVDYGDGRVESHCVTFPEASVSGTDLLSRAGLVASTGSSVVGTSVCMIGDTGCGPGQSCFCQCQGVDCRYWAYFQWQEGAWVYSPIGGGQRQVSDGDADAWMWSDGKSLPSLSPEGICGAASPAVVASATDTPVPELVAAPTSTPEPEPTAATTDTPPVELVAAPTDTPSPEPTVAPAASVPLSAPTVTAPAPEPTATATEGATPTATLPAATVPMTTAIPTAAPTVAAPTATPAAAPTSCLGGIVGWAALVVVAGGLIVVVAKRR